MLLVEILRTSDGIMRVYRDNASWEDHSEYMWSDGNYGCDCNRSKLFHYAAGGTYVDVDGNKAECGDTAYLVRITDPGGKELYRDDDWPEDVTSDKP